MAGLSTPWLIYKARLAVLATHIEDHNLAAMNLLVHCVKEDGLDYYDLLHLIKNPDCAVENIPSTIERGTFVIFVICVL